MGMYIESSRHNVNKTLNVKSNCLMNGYRNIKARFSSVAHGAVGTAASMITRIPRALENVVTGIVKRDISYFGYAAGNIVNAATVDILSGTYFSLKGFVAPTFNKKPDCIQKSLNKLVGPMKFTEARGVRVDSPWQARSISLVRGLSFAVQSLTKGISEVATAIFTQNIFSNATRGLTNIFWYTPKLLMMGVAGTIFISYSKKLGIVISDKQKIIEYTELNSNYFTSSEYSDKMEDLLKKINQLNNESCIGEVKALKQAGHLTLNYNDWQITNMHRN